MTTAMAKTALRTAVLACGRVDRGDDGAAAAAVAGLGSLPAGVVVECLDAVDADVLLALPETTAVVIVDAVAGVAPGRVVEMDLADIAGAPISAGPSSHRLPLQHVVGLVEVLRGRPLAGRFVGVGVDDVSVGADLSPAVRSSLPQMRRAIRIALTRSS